jgi:putative endonuclease
MLSKYYYVYILSSQKNGTLYIGITNNLVRRVWEHKHKLVEGFTNRYEIHHLIYYEVHDNPESAILREKQIKAWKRVWKLNLIEAKNPTWKDLYKDILK